jgi:hypothetical protein
MSRTSERRQVPRFSASGRVEISFEDGVRTIVEAELRETSARGFRISHESRQLVPGLEVFLETEGASKRARVIWTHIQDGCKISGCLFV